MPDYRERVQRALARQRAEASYNKSLDQTAARVPASTLTISDIAEAVADVMKDQRRDLVEHMHRLMKLIELQKPKEDLRDQNLHRRLAILESAVRRLEKGRSR